MAKNSVKIMETVLRDGHQSLCATRMRYRQMEPMLEALDNIGYKALEQHLIHVFVFLMKILGTDSTNSRQN